MIRLDHGAKYGRLIFLRLLPAQGAGKHRRSEWRCDCGAIIEAATSRVVNGYTKSCGCLGPELSRIRARTHGMRDSSEYRSWSAMRARCHNPRCKDYARYGAKGIRVCDEWRHSFQSFFDHVGRRPIGTSLDRIDPRRGYEPGNVRWATPHEQSRNRRDLVVVDTPRGRMALTDWAGAIGISNGAAHNRLRRGKLEGCSRV